MIINQDYFLRDRDNIYFIVLMALASLGKTLERGVLTIIVEALREILLYSSLDFICCFPYFYVLRTSLG